MHDECKQCGEPMEVVDGDFCSEKCIEESKRRYANVVLCYRDVKAVYDNFEAADEHERALIRLYGHDNVRVEVLELLQEYGQETRQE